MLDLFPALSQKTALY
uniref:Uncharacterized protein n=1 Tax=Nymphaea colorata TaxID=210225 RepID=A0A5K0Z2R6_9MAGN